MDPNVHSFPRFGATVGASVGATIRDGSSSPIENDGNASTASAVRFLPRRSFHWAICLPLRVTIVASVGIGRVTTFLIRVPIVIHPHQRSRDSKSSCLFVKRF
jgi:hypothetical protein